MADKEKLIKRSINGIDPGFYKEAKKMAVDQGITIGEVFNRLIKKAVGK